ncbi:MAG: scyllo-inositol 2-dehydrogenase (NAD(+)) [Syntrophomonadaceae bacterium]|nr:scyllo-inositol 2-dehydrogenase (NAD(+)) [Bacillota bacterium]
MLKVGVIGLGAMGRHHVRVYSELPDVELVGIADVDYGLAQSLAEKYRVKPFADYRELLKQHLDAVSIAVPTPVHSEVALSAARTGINMLVEKPIAHTLKDAEEIIKATEENEVKLMVGYIERFNPVVPIIRKEIEGNAVSLIEITRIGPFPPRVKDVGVVIDLATHDIDLIRYLTGSEFKKIYSLTSRNVALHEDAAILLFEMESGVLARVTVNWLTPFKVREITVATKKKFLKALLIDQKVTEYSKYKENDSYLVKEVNVPFSEPLKLELQAFVESIRNNTSPPISGEDGLRALQVAILCLEQGR